MRNKTRKRRTNAGKKHRRVGMAIENDFPAFEFPREKLLRDETRAKKKLRAFEGYCTLSQNLCEFLLLLHFSPLDLFSQISNFST